MSFRKIGLLLIPFACIVLAWGIFGFGWDSQLWMDDLDDILEDMFDPEDLHGFVALSGLTLLIIGILCVSGIADRLVKWIKTDPQENKPCA